MIFIKNKIGILKDTMKRISPLFFIIILGTALRFLCLGSKSMWCDEVWSFFLGKHNISSILYYLNTIDLHPPLFFFLLHFWSYLGESEWILRILPAIFGIFSIPLVYLLGKILFNRKTGYLSAFIFSIIPTHIIWSQTLRHYSMLTFFSLLSFYFFFKVLRERKTIFWIGYIICTVGTIYTHNYGLVVPLIEGLYFIFLLKKHYPLWKEWLLSQLVIILCYFPWVPFLLEQFYRIKGSRAQSSPILLLCRVFFDYVLGQAISPLNFKVVIPAVLVSGILFVFGIFSLRKFNRETRIFSLFYFVVFLIFILVFPSSGLQNFVVFSPFYYFFFALGMLKGKNKLLKEIKIFSFLLILSPSLFYYYTENSLQFHDASRLAPYREICSYINQHSQKDEIVLTTDKPVMVLTNTPRYFKEGEIISITTKGLVRVPDNSIFDWYYKGPLPVVRIISQIDEEKNKQTLEETIEKYQQIWVLLFNNSKDCEEWNGKIKEYFEKKCKKVLEKKYVKNERTFESFLKGQIFKPEYYYFVELYLYKKE